MNAHMIYVHCVSIVISGLHVICISFRTKVRITHNTHAHTHQSLLNADCTRIVAYMCVKWYVFFCRYFFRLATDQCLLTGVMKRWG